MNALVWRGLRPGRLSTAARSASRTGGSASSSPIAATLLAVVGVSGTMTSSTVVVAGSAGALWGGVPRAVRRRWRGGVALGDGGGALGGAGRAALAVFNRRSRYALRAVSGTRGRRIG